MDNRELAALIRAAQAGSPGAFGELVDRHYELMHRFAWKWSGHRTDAEDIAQQACLKLAQSLAQFRFEATFRSWLYRLVVSCAHDWQRRAMRKRSLPRPAAVPARVHWPTAILRRSSRRRCRARRPGNRHRKCSKWP